MAIIIFGEASELVLTVPFGELAQSHAEKSDSSSLGIELLKALLSRPGGTDKSQISVYPCEYSLSESSIEPKAVKSEIFVSEVSREKRGGKLGDRLAPNRSTRGEIEEVSVNDQKRIFSRSYPNLDGPERDIVVIFLPRREEGGHVSSTERNKHKNKMVLAVQTQLKEYLREDDRKNRISKLIVLSDFESAKTILKQELQESLPGDAEILAFCNINDFRNHSFFNISKGYSWEKTVQEFEEQVVDPNNLARLAKMANFSELYPHNGGFKHAKFPFADAIFFRCDLDGIIICSTKEDKPRPSIVFNASAAEGDFRKEYPQRFYDEPEVFLTVVIERLLEANTNQSPEIPVCEIAVDALVAVRKHIAHGYKNNRGSPSGIDLLSVFERSYYLNHQFAKLELLVDKPNLERSFSDPLTTVRNSNPLDSGNAPETTKNAVRAYQDVLAPWRAKEFLSSFLEFGNTSEAHTIKKVAKAILSTGRPPNALEIDSKKATSGRFSGAICTASFEKLITIDRNEIESFRSTRQILRDYLQQNNSMRPLSLAVFGPPGCGKSFGVKQICAELHGEFPNVITKHSIDVNMSMLEHSTQLIAAFHSVRNLVIEGKVPVVFFDEFDSSNNGIDFFWLKYFLAPMQDGEFRDGEATHKIGKAIFIFAGGTESTFENFESKGEMPKNSGGGESSNEADKNALAAFEKNRKAKLPDFTSRIANFINISGPNKRQKSDPNTGAPVDDDTDNMYLVRRAMLLKAFVTAKTKTLRLPNNKPLISEEIQDAFLNCKKFKHGTRSIETIVSRSEIEEKKEFTISCLPPTSVLSIHVDDVGEFLGRSAHPEAK